MRTSVCSYNCDTVNVKIVKRKHSKTDVQSTCAEGQNSTLNQHDIRYSGFQSIFIKSQNVVNFERNVVTQYGIKYLFKTRTTSCEHF